MQAAGLLSSPRRHSTPRDGRPHQRTNAHTLHACGLPARSARGRVHGGLAAMRTPHHQPTAAEEGEGRGEGRGEEGGDHATYDSTATLTDKQCSPTHHSHARRVPARAEASTPLVRACRSARMGVCMHAAPRCAPTRHLLLASAPCGSNGSMPTARARMLTNDRCGLLCSSRTPIGTHSARNLRVRSSFVYSFVAWNSMGSASGASCAITSATLSRSWSTKHAS